MIRGGAGRHRIAGVRGSLSTLASPSFFAPFADSGAGATNLTLSIGTGSATFTRATSATCWSSAGLLLTVGTGVARSTYTELTGATYLGYLSEEARTNSCIQNRDFTNVAWVKTTMTAALDQVGLDGASNAASSLLATAGNALAAQTIVIAAVNRPFSVYVKRLVGTGNIGLAQDGATFTDIAVANDGLYHRITLVASQLNPVLSIRLATNADKIAVDYAMLEDTGGAAAAFPNSPIATTTVAVTRNIDSLSYAKAGNVSDTAGVLYAETMFPATVPSGTVYAISGGGASTVCPLGKTNAAGGKLTAFDQGGANNANSAATVNDAAVHKCASRWGNALLDIWLDGTKGTGAAYNGTYWPATFFIGLGISSQFSLNGTVRNLKVFTAALTDGQVASL